MNAKQTKQQATPAVATPVVPVTEGKPTTEQIAAAKAILSAAGVTSTKVVPSAEVIAEFNTLKAKHEAELNAFHLAHPEVKGGRKGPGPRSSTAVAETMRLRTLAGNPSKIQMHQVYGKKTYASKNWAQLNAILPAELFQECLKAGKTATEFMASRS